LFIFCTIAILSLEDKKGNLRRMDQITVAKEVICQINIFEDVLNDATKSNGNYKG